METGKYGPLADYLGKLRRTDSDARQFTLSFSEIEQIIGCKLPASARASASFWGNDLTHTQARTWIDECWLASDVSIEKEHVTFLRNLQATQKAKKLNDLETLRFIHRSRRVADDQMRKASALMKTNASRRDPDRDLLSKMVWGLDSLDYPVDIEIHPPPSRGRRTKPGPGSLTVACGKDGKTRMRMMFVNERMEVDVTLEDDLGVISRWPADRADQAWLFMPLWEADYPWLVVSKDHTARDAPLTLHASLSFPRYPPNPECTRVVLWLTRETEAFEEGLRKILRRRTPMTAHRAMQLARRKLARHARPRKTLVESDTLSVDHDLLSHFASILDGKAVESGPRGAP